MRKTSKIEKLKTGCPLVSTEGLGIPLVLGVLVTGTGVPLLHNTIKNSFTSFIGNNFHAPNYFFSSQITFKTLHTIISNTWIPLTLVLSI